MGSGLSAGSGVGAARSKRNSRESLTMRLDRPDSTSRTPHKYWPGSSGKFVSASRAAKSTVAEFPRVASAMPRPSRIASCPAFQMITSNAWLADRTPPVTVHEKVASPLLVSPSFGLISPTVTLPGATDVLRLVAGVVVAVGDVRVVGTGVAVGGMGDGVRVGMGVEVGTSPPPPDCGWCSHPGGRRRWADRGRTSRPAQPPGSAAHPARPLAKLRQWRHLQRLGPSRV